MRLYANTKKCISVSMKSRVHAATAARKNRFTLNQALNMIYKSSCLSLSC